MGRDGMATHGWVVTVWQHRPGPGPGPGQAKGQGQWPHGPLVRWPHGPLGGHWPQWLSGVTAPPDSAPCPVHESGALISKGIQGGRNGGMWKYTPGRTENPPGEGGWGHGDPWGTWETLGTLGDPMGSHGGPWGPMGIIGGLGDPMGTMGALGDPRCPRGSHGGPWDPLESMGALGPPMEGPREPHGDPWEPSGTPWETMGALGGPWGALGNPWGALENQIDLGIIPN